MRYFLIAGEASGDLHGSNLMKALLRKDPQAIFSFWGGDRMRAVADGLLRHYKEDSIMGFVEVLFNIRTILRNLDTCRKQILEHRPDVVILIDYPGFNFRIAEFCKTNGIKVCWFIAPKVWAWKEDRAKKLEKFVDLLLLILPFEQSYFKKWKVRSEYVGNPLMDELAAFEPDPSFKPKHGLDQRPVIALLPGSRPQEIRRMLPLMVQLQKEMASHQFVVAGAPGIDPGYYSRWLSPGVKVVYHSTYDLLHHAELAVVCSGTATLEAALHKVPQVCCYAAHPVSFRIAKMLVNLPYISLVNLCMQRKVIEELLQDDYNAENLRNVVAGLLPGGAAREPMLDDYRILREMLGGEGASQRAAEHVIALASPKS
jgi:lipid-A-disaccharide synthase